MAQMTDMMVDIETMGTNPHLHGVIQLSAIKFNYETEEIGGMFDRCPMPLPQRGWSDGTREFWMGKNRPVYESIIMRAEPAVPVWEDFLKFALEDAPEGGFRFWGKPITFDFMFVADALESLGHANPFHFRYARDLNSFMAGLAGDPLHPDMESKVVNHGTAHLGLHDCAYQIDMLFHQKHRFITTEVMS
jgi:hypothetical protein